MKMCAHMWFYVRGALMCQDVCTCTCAYMQGIEGVCLCTDVYAWCVFVCEDVCVRCTYA